MTGRDIARAETERHPPRYCHNGSTISSRIARAGMARARRQLAAPSEPPVEPKACLTCSGVGRDLPGMHKDM
ncbi:hypothetical protein MCC01970_05530 [Bifidobacteriaceae bacterium MCC01970]|nr:hypothetical protein MCC01970_05530 [Bifidobacteriaceae bacterium MCC01970]